MKIDFYPTKPDDIELSMTITMSLKDWVRLKDQLQTDFPSWKLSDAIRDMVGEADQHFHPAKNDTNA